MAHNFVLNYDSYTGGMLHNYYLLQENGKISILPWDYNLAFGSFSNIGGGRGNNEANDGETKDGNSKDAASLINWGIDTPLSGATEESRPLWNMIYQSKEYMQKYHEKFAELVASKDEYLAEIDRVYNMIEDYVKNDPSSFFKEGEFSTAVETLKNFITLRVESIQKQLNGEIPSSSTEQKRGDYDLVDGSSINIDSMGKFSNGNSKGFPGR